MARESLYEVIDQIADWVGVYGAHDNDEPRPRFPPEMHCRVCFVATMEVRIKAAVDFDAIMARVSIAPASSGGTADG
jgi:hypothetical protein